VKRSWNGDQRLPQARQVRRTCGQAVYPISARWLMEQASTAVPQPDTVVTFGLRWRVLQKANRSQRAGVGSAASRGSSPLSRSRALFVLQLAFGEADLHLMRPLL